MQGKWVLDQKSQFWVQNHYHIVLVSTLIHNTCLLAQTVSKIMLAVFQTTKVKNLGKSLTLIKMGEDHYELQLPTHLFLFLQQKGHILRNVMIPSFGLRVKLMV